MTGRGSKNRRGSCATGTVGTVPSGPIGTSPAATAGTPAGTAGAGTPTGVGVLLPSFRRIGVGVAHGPFKGHDDAMVVTADFQEG